MSYETKSILQIKSNVLFSSEVKLLNSQGFLLETWQNVIGKQRIDLQSLENGFYYLEIVSVRGNEVRKIVKMR